VTLVTCSGPVPEFNSVIDFAVLLAPCTTDPKLIEAGETEAIGAVPVPESVTVCTAPAFPESSLIVSAPLTAPAADGVNVTVTAQFDPAESCDGQLFVSPNPPLAAIVPKVSGLPPKFVIVTACVPVVPRFCVKLTVDGLKLMAEGRGEGKGIGTAP
jgi:hypothetical protein